MPAALLSTSPALYMHFPRTPEFLLGASGLLPLNFLRSPAALSQGSLLSGLTAAPFIQPCLQPAFQPSSSRSLPGLAEWTSWVNQSVAVHLSYSTPPPPPPPPSSSFYQHHHHHYNHHRHYHHLLARTPAVTSQLFSLLPLCCLPVSCLSHSAKVSWTIPCSDSPEHAPRVLTSGWYLLYNLHLS